MQLSLNINEVYKVVLWKRTVPQLITKYPNIRKGKWSTSPLNIIFTLMKDWLIRVRGLGYLKDPKCHAGGNLATGRVTHAGQDEAERRD